MPDPSTHVPRQPVPPHGFLCEVAFRDALTGWPLTWTMGICVVACAATCSSVHVEKVKLYHLVVRNIRLHYAQGLCPRPLACPRRSQGASCSQGCPR